MIKALFNIIWLMLCSAIGMTHIRLHENICHFFLSFLLFSFVQSETKWDLYNYNLSKSKRKKKYIVYVANSLIMANMRISQIDFETLLLGWLLPTSHNIQNPAETLSLSFFDIICNEIFYSGSLITQPKKKKM